MISEDRTRSYETAMTVAELITKPDGSASETIKIVEATLAIQRVAFASTVYSVMLQRRVSIFHLLPGSHSC